MDVIIPRKIQIPTNPEAGFGAMAPDGSTILNEPLVRELGLTEEEIKLLTKQVLEEIKRRNRKFRGNKPCPNQNGKTVILVDDGLASGYTMLAAIKSVKKQKPKRIIVAVPTAPLSSARLVASQIDQLICLNIRRGPFFAVADAYQKWYDLKDGEVMEYLRKARKAGLSP
jgi:predicted phosphoribosyltransferase